MHILYVSQYFPPEMGAPAARVYELAREWVRMGHRVTVITGFPNHPTGVVPPEYRGRWFQREDRDGIEVVRTWLYAAPNKGTTRRILNYLSFPLTAVCLGVPAVRSCDVVIGTSPQLLVGLAGCAAGMLLRRPFVFEVRDLWPDGIEAVEAIRSRSVLKALRFVEEFLYRRAAKIVAVTYSTPRILVSRGFDEAKMAVVPNGVDLELFERGSRDNEVRRRYAPSDRFVVSYIGTHGMAHALEQVLDAAESLKSEGGYRFLLVGEGAEKDRLEARARERGLSNVTFVGQQPRELIPAFYQASDACLVPLKDIPLHKAVLPSKMFEIMGVARPILLCAAGEARELMEEAGAGLAVDPEAPEQLVAAIRKLGEDADLCRRLGEQGRTFVEASFSRSALARKYAAILENVVAAWRRPLRSPSSVAADAKAPFEAEKRPEPWR